MTGCLGEAASCHLSRCLAYAQGRGSVSQLTTHTGPTPWTWGSWTHVLQDGSLCRVAPWGTLHPQVFSLTIRGPRGIQIISLCFTPFATAAKWSLLLRVFLKLVDVFASLPLSPGSRLLLSISPKLGLKMTYWVNFIFIGAVFDSSWANFVGLFLVGPRYCKAHSPRFKIQRITKNHKKWKQCSPYCLNLVTAYLCT